MKIFKSEYRALRSSTGFTLVELIIVIVILGILAVTAAPKFINMQSDARKAALEGLAGAMKSAAMMAYGKAVVAGADGGTESYICMNKSATSSCQSTDADAVEVLCGYPNSTEAGIVKALDVSLSDITANDKTTDFVYRTKVWPSGAKQVLMTLNGQSLPEAYRQEDATTYENQCYIFYDSPCLKIPNGDGTYYKNNSSISIKVFTDGC